MKTLYTVLSTLFLLLAVFFIFIYSGVYDPGSLTKHNSFTLWAIKTTLNHSIEKRAKEISVPGNLNDTSVLQVGFEHYNEMCTGCHGAPGIETSEVARGLYPDPPLLYKPENIIDPKTTFWIIKNGIKMSGMPALSPTHSDDKIWAITAFITHRLGNMSPKEYKSWQQKYATETDDDK